MAIDLLKPHDQATLAETIQNVPTRVKQRLRLGLEGLTDVAPATLTQLAEISAGAAFSPYGYDPAELAGKTGLTEDAINQYVNATGFLSALVSAFPDASAADLLSTLQEEKLISGDAPVVSEQFSKILDSFVANGHGISTELERAALAAGVLPLMTQFRTQVDLRLPDTSDAISKSAVVVVAMIDTDAEGEQIWFQMTRLQVSKMVQQLQECQKNLARAEELVRKFG